MKALRQAGWHVVRGVDTFPQKTLDPEHFEKAAELGRALVTNDQPMVAIAHQWLEEGRRFKGMVTWPRAHYNRMTIGDLLRKFEELTESDEPWGIPWPLAISSSPTAR